MVVACSTRSFPRDRMEIALAKVAWAGFKGVELALEDAPEDAAPLKQRLRDEELQLVSIYAGVLGAQNQDQALARAAPIGRLANLARELDGPRVVVTAPEMGDQETLAFGLQTLLGALQRVNVEVCLANHAGTLVALPEDLRRLREAAPWPSHGFALDPAQALLAGWDPAAPRHWPSVPRLVYLNDAREGSLCPPGRGEVDWPRLAGALRQAGFDGPLALLLAGAADYEVEPAAKEARVAAEEWFQIGW